MLKKYIKLALKVLLRHKFFTFVSLFGISFTLMILLVMTAFLDHIPAALANLHWIAVEREILTDLAPLLKLGGNRVA